MIDHTTSNPSSSIQTIEATGEEIYEIVSALAPIIDQFPLTHSIIAMISMAVSLQTGPSISSEQVQDMVLKVSQYICLLLDDTVEVSDKARMN